jgi:hypothetical protein
LAVEVATLDGASDDELVVASAVVGAVAVFGVRCGRSRRREGGDVVGDSHLVGGVVEADEAGAQLVEEVGVGGELAAVGVVAVGGAEEDLARKGREWSEWR